MNTKKFHVTTFLPPSLAQVLFRGTLLLIMAQQKRGFKFALSILLQSSPSLLCKTMGKAKKEEAMQESHCNDGGMEDVVMEI
jgi:hypothetical protein